MTTPFRRAARLMGATLGTTLLATSLVLVTSGPASADEGAITRIKVTQSDKIKMPSQLAPGVHRIVVKSKGNAALQLVRAAKGYTKAEFTRDLLDGFENDVRAFNRFERNTDIIAGVSTRPDGKGVMWVKLRRGTYWALDTDAPPRADKIRTFQVRGDSVGGSLPRDATLTAAGVSRWADTPTSMPASGDVRLRNESRANHFFGIARLKAGRTMADVDAWVEGILNGDEGPSPIRFGIGTESGVVGPGHQMTMRYDLPPGEYVLLCFWPMPEHDFMPHMFMGMYRQLTLT